MGKQDTYICPECGAKMEKADEEVVVCPSCQYWIEIKDYGHEHDYDDYYESISNNTDDDEPDCCKACGGPYPSCMTSCKIFDD